MQVSGVIMGSAYLAHTLHQHNMRWLSSLLVPVQLPAWP